MVSRGEIAVSGRRGRDPLWDLASRVYPDEPAVTPDEAIRTRNQLRLQALGIARAKAAESPGEPNDVGVVGEEATVEGVKGSWQVDPAYLDLPFEPRTALLSPLDRLVFDRKRLGEIFDFDYQLEMYKPAAKRRWGYWAMPILYGDQLVGKLDATADRKAGVPPGRCHPPGHGLRQGGDRRRRSGDRRSGRLARARTSGRRRLIHLPAQLGESVESLSWLSRSASAARSPVSSPSGPPLSFTPPGVSSG